MFFLDGFLCILTDDMGVNLRCCNIGMTQHFLDGAQVGAVFQKMRCKSVAQDVRADLAGLDFRFGGQILKELGKTLACQVAAFRCTRGEQPLCLLPLSSTPINCSRTAI